MSSGAVERRVRCGVDRYAELTGAAVTTPSAMTYALFQQALLRHLAGSEAASTALHAHMGQLLGRVVPAP